MKKLVKESLSDKLKGPSKEDVLKKMKNMDPQDALIKSMWTGFPDGVIQSLERGSKFPIFAMRTELKKIIRKFTPEQIEKFKNEMKNRRILKEFFQYTLNLKDFKKYFSEREINYFKEILKEDKNYRDLIKLGIRINDQELVKKYRGKILSREYKNVSSKELKKYLSPSLRYPKGYILYRILKFIQKNQPVKYTNIIKFVLSLKGESYTPEKRGYYGTNIQNAYSKYLKKEKDGWYISDEGILKFQELKRKLKEKYPKLIE